MADAPNGRRETVAWAVGTSIASLLAAMVGGVQLIQEPMERDFAALSRRVDEAVSRSESWRADFRDQLQTAVIDSIDRGEERREAMAERLNQVDQAHGMALGELAARIARIEADRARMIEGAIGRLQRVEDHLNAVDERLVRIEESFTSVLRGDAVRPDRFGGPPYPSRDQ